MKLCDFGFAKIDQGDLMTPQFTPYYVAPQVNLFLFQHEHDRDYNCMLCFNFYCDIFFRYLRHKEDTRRKSLE